MSAIAENSAPATKAPAAEVAAVVPGIYIGISGYEKADASWFGCCVGGRAHISEACTCISFSCTSSSLFCFYFILFYFAALDHYAA